MRMRIRALISPPTMPFMGLCADYAHVHMHHLTMHAYRHVTDIITNTNITKQVLRDKSIKVMQNVYANTVTYY